MHSEEKPFFQGCATLHSCPLKLLGELGRGALDSMTGSVGMRPGRPFSARVPDLPV